MNTMLIRIHVEFTPPEYIRLSARDCFFSKMFEIQTAWRDNLAAIYLISYTTRICDEYEVDER